MEKIEEAQDWEELFRDKFVSQAVIWTKDEEGLVGACFHLGPIKSFISQLLLSERSKLKEEIEKITVTVSSRESDEYDSGRVDMKKDILNLLKK